MGFEPRTKSYQVTCSNDIYTRTNGRSFTFNSLQPCYAFPIPWSRYIQNWSEGSCDYSSPRGWYVDYHWAWGDDVTLGWGWGWRESTWGGAWCPRFVDDHRKGKVVWGHLNKWMEFVINLMLKKCGFRFRCNCLVEMKTLSGVVDLHWHPNMSSISPYTDIPENSFKNPWIFHV